jgi:hypothetical protein
MLHGMASLIFWISMRLLLPNTRARDHYLRLEYQELLSDALQRVWG